MATRETNIAKVEDSGDTSVTMGTALDRFNDAIKVYPPVATVTRITTATTTVVSAVPVWVRAAVQNGTMGATTFYDNSAASGTVEWTGTPAAKDVLFRDWTYFATGCTVVTAAATEILVETITVA
jgi:hypothetical protein